MSRTALSLLFLVTLVGCEPGRQPIPEGVESRENPPSDGEINPCQLLSPSMVASLADVPEADLVQSQIPVGCAYIWQGGAASFGPLYIFETDDEAVAFFSETFRSLTSEEAAQVTEQTLTFVEEQSMAGTLNDAEAEAMRRDAILREDALQSVNYETIGGIGDRARYDATIRPTVRPYIGEVVVAESNLAVQLRNVVFVVSGDLTETDNPDALRRGPSQQHLRRNRDFTLGLARRSVEAILQTSG